MWDVKVGDQVRGEFEPPNAVAPLTVSGIHKDYEGRTYYEGFWANGAFGVLFPEELVEVGTTEIVGTCWDGYGGGC